MSVEVINVTRTFRGAPAVRGLSVSVPSGAVTGLVGPNGAGKTTLLLMLAALLRPDTGTIRVNGLDPVTQPREVHRVVGWMPDSFGTWDSLTCTEILQTFAVAQGVDGGEVVLKHGGVDLVLPRGVLAHCFSSCSVPSVSAGSWRCQAGPSSGDRSARRLGSGETSRFISGWTSRMEPATTKGASSRWGE